MSKSKRVFALVFAQGFNAFVNFFFFPYFVRVLSQQDYGTYGQVLLVSDTIRTLATLGLTVVIYVSMGQAEDPKSGLDPRSVFKSIFYSSIVLSFIGSIITFLTAGLFGDAFNNEQMVQLLRIYSINMVFFVPYTVLNALLIYLGLLRRSVFITSFVLILRVTSLVLVVEFFHSLTAVFYVLVGLGVLQLCLMAFCTPREFFTKGSFSFEYALSRLRLGVQLGFIELIWFCTAYTDKFIVSSQLSVDAFAIYRNGTIELPVIGTLYTSIAAVILPMISKLYSEGKYDEIVALKKRSITATCGVLYPVIFYLIVFSHSLVLSYFSKKYEASAIVFAIISCNLFLRVNDYQDILVSAARGRVLVLIYLCTFIMNLFVSYFMIRSFGFIGAACSTLLSYFVSTGALFIFSARTIRKSWMDFLEFKKLGMICVVSFALPFTCYQFGGYEKPIVMLLYGAFCTITSYFIFFYLRIVSYSNIAPLVEKVPLIGGKLNQKLQALFANQRITFP